jgi:hypothetical protein
MHSIPDNDIGRVYDREANPDDFCNWLEILSIEDGKHD